MTTIPHPNNIAGWREFARRDDCLDLMTPSDLRQLIASRQQPLSLRDHFAGLAIQRLLASDAEGALKLESVIKAAYEIADAMITEGSK